MKIRKLRKILNNTGYALSNEGDYLAVGNAYIHNIIMLNKKTLELTTYCKNGRNEFESNSGKNVKLRFIWDKMTELIASGEIEDILEGKDVIENPLPVFTVVDGEVVESVTDSYEYPSTDNDGVLLHKNTHFPEKNQAIAEEISCLEARIEGREERIAELKKEVKTVEDKVTLLKGYLFKLKNEAIKCN
jgi:chromosome segregation ATPase